MRERITLSCQPLALKANGKWHDLLVNDTDGYFGKVKLPSGTRYVKIQADGPWTMVCN